MTAKMLPQKKWKAIATGIGCAVALFLGSGPADVLAQQTVASPANATGPGWYGYVPGTGWVLYSPSSAPAPTTSAAGPLAPTTAPPPGWAGYAPGTAWTGYAPASSPFLPAVRPGALVSVSPNSPHRYAANLAVNHIAPQFEAQVPWYREYGSGRNVPIAKPWLPSSP